MTDKNTLDLAKEWAADIDADRETLSQDTIDAAADLISSLPDAWVSVEELREFVANWRAGLAPVPRDGYEDEILDDLEDRLPTPEQDDEPVFDPGYIYTDRDGDEWEHLDGRWIAGDTHAERVAGRESRPGYPRLPERYGPYTRIEKEEITEQDDVPEFDPSYTYRDKDGDEWKFSIVEKAWVCYDRETGDLQMIRPQPLAVYAPYTRIEA